MKKRFSVTDFRGNSLHWRCNESNLRFWKSRLHGVASGGAGVSAKTALAPAHDYGEVEVIEFNGDGTRKCGLNARFKK